MFFLLGISNQETSRVHAHPHTQAPSQEESGDAGLERPTWNVSVGVKGALVANILSPADPSPTLNPPLPGFSGQSGGVFLTGQILYLDTVGLEIGLGGVNAYGEGVFTYLTSQEAVRVEQTLETTEIHIPLLIKGQLPWWRAKPFLSLGITPVLQTNASYRVDRDDITTEIFDPEPSSYVMYTLGVGTHIDAGPLRFPLELRALYGPRQRDPNTRVEYTYSETDQGLILETFSVRSLWEAQFMILFGAEYMGWTF